MSWHHLHEFWYISACKWYNIRYRYRKVNGAPARHELPVLFQAEAGIYLCFQRKTSLHSCVTIGFWNTDWSQANISIESNFLSLANFSLTLITWILTPTSNITRTDGVHTHLHASAFMAAVENVVPISWYDLLQRLISQAATRNRFHAGISLGNWLQLLWDSYQQNQEVHSKGRSAISKFRKKLFYCSAFGLA